ncbi:hypothetical protein BCR42DRAFT_430043 [Absidia repens]|uniref:RRM domain-containing protein n=1 Tax=Absidia repens TaxID=90262 RepID=A0A1X2HKC7_9FUNG|nr:hypothetical protein BCR42DRAFT_430043 [Absidia repens]
MAIPLACHDVTLPPVPQPAYSSTQSTLWMGDLETWMDEQYIQQLWYHWSDQVQVKVIRDKTTGISLGYCFIDFGTHLMAQQIMNLYQGKRMPHSSSKTFKLNWASGGGLFDKKHDRIPEYSIFVGDIPPDCSDTILFSVFQTRYPSCKSAKIMTDPTTGQSRGYGFIRFHDRLDQQRALIEMQGFLFVNNRPIRVSLATPKQRTHHPSNPSSPLSSSSASSSSSSSLLLPTTNTMPLTTIAASMPLPPPQQLSPTPTPTPPPLPLPASTASNRNTTIFVGGLSAPIKEDDLRHYFTPFGDIVYVKIPVGKGCGFVQYVSHASAALAIHHMNGYQIGSCRIRLSWGKTQQPPPSVMAAQTATTSTRYTATSILPPLSSIPSPITAATTTNTAHHDLKLGLGFTTNTRALLSSSTAALPRHHHHHHLSPAPAPPAANGRTSALTWPLNHIYAQ